MLTSSVVCDAICFFTTRKCQKIRAIDKNGWYWKRKSPYLLNELRNFNEIFKEDVTYNNIKSHKKPGLHPFSEKHIFGKITGGDKCKKGLSQ